MKSGEIGHHWPLLSWAMASDDEKRTVNDKLILSYTTRKGNKGVLSKSGAMVFKVWRFLDSHCFYEQIFFGKRSLGAIVVDVKFSLLKLEFS